MTYSKFDPKLLEVLSKLDIEFDYLEHPPAKTMQDMVEIDTKLKGVVPKNLLLKHKSGLFCLVSLLGEKKLNTKIVATTLNIPNNFSFASADQLYQVLKITPGSVSIFTLVNAIKEVMVVLDEDIYNSEFVSYHPNHNEATITLSQVNFKKFWQSVEQKKLVVKL